MNAYRNLIAVLATAALACAMVFTNSVCAADKPIRIGILSSGSLDNRGDLDKDRKSVV